MTGIRVDFNECNPMIPPVDWHVVRGQLAQTPTRPSGDQITVQIAFRVFACLMVVSANGGRFRAVVKPTSGIHR